MIILLSTIPILLLAFHPVTGQYNDDRCKCICPSPQVVTPNETLRNVSISTSSLEKPERSVYIGNVDREQCNCDGVVLSQLTADVQGKAKEFCPWCECKYESRNTTTIKWVVSLVIAIIAVLVVYMTFLILFDPLLHKGRRQYEEQIDDDQTEMREPHDQDPAVSSLQSMDEYTQFNSIIRPSPRNSISEAAADHPEVMVSIAGPAAAGANGGAGSVLNRAVQHQNKWKKQVQEQRKNIYDNHTMLN